MRPQVKRAYFKGRCPGLGVTACLVLVYVLASAGPQARAADLSGQQRSPDFPRVEIERISYVGDDHYRVEMEIVNESARPAVLKVFEVLFEAQTETGFVQLRETPGSTLPGGGGTPLPAGEKKRIVASVKIPLDAPRIFRTYEGDVSFVVRYRLQTTSESDQRQGELYCWITPRTDHWILREGM